MQPITLRISTSCSSPSGDVSDCYRRYDYDVELSQDDGDSVIIGKGVSVLYLYDKAMAEGIDILDAFDENHHEDIYDTLFDGGFMTGTAGIKEEWQELLEENDIYNNNILVTDRLEILPEYQHQGYGRMVRQILRDFFSDSFGIEILHSFPLQLELFDNATDPWRSQMNYDSMERDAVLAQESLNRSYISAGYSQYRDTDYFYCLPSDDLPDDDEWADDEW